MPVYPEPASSTTVQLEAASVFQILRHLNDQFPRSAGGILLGMNQDELVQVTESFALPASSFDGDGSNLRSKSTIEYQTEMIHQLKVVNADCTLLGWYVSSSLGAIYEQSFLDNMYYYQQQNPEAVMIVHDVALSRSSGNLVLKAYRLSQQYLAVKKEGKFNTQNLVANRLKYHDLFEEVPVRIHNSHFVNLMSVVKGPEPTFNELQLPSTNLLETNVESILDSVDDFCYDQNNYNYYQRQVTRENQKISNWQQKRRQENAALEAAGKPLLSVDEYKVLFKMPEEPSRADNLLISAQIDEFCNQIDELSAAASSTLLATKY